MLEMLSMVKQGGWCMYPLGACSLAALAIVLERGLALRRRIVIPARVIDALDDYESDVDADAAIAACQRAGGAFSRIVIEAIKQRHLEHAQAIESMNAVGRTQVNRLERGLTVLEIITGVSPLLGLLGTVLGMVDVFNAITAGGLGNAQMLSAGISKALITTVAGLCIAIPALAAHSLLSKRVDELATEMQDRATNFIMRLQTLNGRKR